MLVVLPADFLDRLTLRKIIAFLPIAVLVVAFAHNVPLPPEILFLGDALAYLDILTIIFLLAAIGRAGAGLYVVRRVAVRLASRVAGAFIAIARRADARHRRPAHGRSGRRSLFGNSRNPEDDGIPLRWGAPA
jgi:hypothetical protein